MLLEKRSKSTKAINEINVVPYVDIMLVLLVIFMVVAPLAVQGLDINLPSVPEFLALSIRFFLYL